MLEILKQSSMLIILIMIESNFVGVHQKSKILEFVDKSKFIDKTYSSLFGKLAETQREDVIYFQEDLNKKELELFLELVEMVEDIGATNERNIALEHLGNYYKNAIHSTNDTSKILMYSKEIARVDSLRNEVEDKRNTYEIIMTEIEPPLDTNYALLDKKVGLRKANTYIIGAGTGKGKSTFALNLATKMSFKGHKGIYFSPEMTKEETMSAIVSSLTSVERWKFTRQQFNDDELNRIKKMSNKFDGANLEIDADTRSFFGIENKIKQTDNLDYVVIDYIGLVEYPERDTRTRIGILSREFKKLAKDLNICIILAVQLNRLAESDTPTLTNLADSADLERDASSVMLLDRERGERDAKLIIAKNRFGEITEIPMYFELEYARIQETEEI